MAEKIIDGSWLTVTRACEARCGWCYAQSTGFKGSDAMSLELAVKLVNIIADSGGRNVVLIGGEPTQYKHFFDIIAHIRKRNLKPDVVTNGFSFARHGYAMRVKNAGVEMITLSIKAPTDAGYEQTTGVKRGMTRVRQALNACREAGIEVALSVTVSVSFLESIDTFLKTLVDLKPLYLDFGLADPVVMADRVHVYGVPSPEEHARAVEHIHRYMKQTGVDYSFELNIPFCLLDTTVKEELLERGSARRSCHIPQGAGLIFDEKGNVLPCNLFSVHRLGSFGVDFTDSDSFASFWQSQDVNDFRDAVASYPSAHCVMCPEWNECGGGCVIKWLYWDPAQYIPGLVYSNPLMSPKQVYTVVAIFVIFVISLLTFSSLRQVFVRTHYHS